MFPFPPAYPLFPLQLFPIHGMMQPTLLPADSDEEWPFGPYGNFTTEGFGPHRKRIRHLQRAGLIGPLIPNPMMGPYGVTALPPW